MTYKNLEIVALNHDLSSYGLKKGDTGTIVDIYEGGKAYEVEFMTEEGKTIAVLTLDRTEINPKTHIVVKSQKAERSDETIQHETIKDSPLVYPSYISLYLND